MRDLSILVSTPIVMVAMMTVWVRHGSWVGRFRLTKCNDHGALDIIRDEGDLESSECFQLLVGTN